MTLDLIKIRRDLHQIPEIGLEEFKTQAYLLERIAEMTEGKDFVEQRTWRTGILVFLHGSAPEKTIGWRTDIDGLPIVEETGLDFKSIHEGRMHACGHDIHMTTALGLLDQMLQVQPKNNMLFLFQPAEENEAGGMLMYEDGAFGDWLPDEFYGLHVRPDFKVGDIATNTNTLFAGTCEVLVTFKGKGGHAAFPHEANDALVAASYFITQVQTIVSRNVDPIQGGVVTFGSFHAGTTNNVIAETAEVYGTIRTLTQEMSLLIQKRVRQIAEGVAASFGMEVDMNQLFGTLYNKALEGDKDCGGLLSYGYLSGENITGVTEGRPLFVRSPESRFNLANFMRTHLYTSLGALKVGMDILLKEEHVQIDKILGHGGLFKTKGVGQGILAAAIDTPVSVMETAGEGGPWGMALLASYMLNKESDETLAHYLSEKVFVGNKGTSMDPDPEDVKGFETFIERYKKGIAIEKAALENLIV